MLYEWLKAFHIVAVIAWMAGMLYLPRLFVYHADVPAGSDRSEMLKVMERRLLKAIINPAMIATWVLGISLAWMSGFYASPWLWLKFGLVLGLSVVHGHLAKATRLFAQDRNERSSRYWRVLNEVPTVLMIAIVLLVVLKPF